MTITLIRKKHLSKAVQGIMTIPFDTPLQVPTLENADFLIPEGTYKLERTWSPKFKKNLPELIDVPERSGIRIHKGTLPEHSTGCILTDMMGMSHLDILFNKITKNAEIYESQPEEIYIRIAGE